MNERTNSSKRRAPWLSKLVSANILLCLKKRTIILHSTHFSTFDSYPSPERSEPGCVGNLCVDATTTTTTSLTCPSASYVVCTYTHTHKCVAPDRSTHVILQPHANFHRGPSTNIWEGARKKGSYEATTLRRHIVWPSKNQEERELWSNR